MSQTAIPFLFMRGGTSRGPYMRRSDLPEDRETLSEVLISIVGAGHPLNIDGVGGGATVTTKTAMLSPGAEDAWEDVEYFFAQVDVTQRLVDYKPTCGNILAAVGPAAIEMGLVTADTDETRVKIRAVNTGARIEAVVQTPLIEGARAVLYDGDTAIDGAPGTAAPVTLNFYDTAGSITGALLPTGDVRDVIDGVAVTCMDLAMPVVVARAADVGISGHESREELEENAEFMARIERLRLAAAEAMGMGDARESVTPKIAFIAEARSGGAFAARYFTPWTCHPTMAVTGAQCLAGCALTPGTVADRLWRPPTASPSAVSIEHPLGAIDVLMTFSQSGDSVAIEAAGLVRTARKLAAGEIFAPRAVWAGR